MKTLKPLLIIASIMLLLAVPPVWPYAYYQILRIVVCIAAAYGAYTTFATGKNGWGWMLGAVAILFNPITPIHLDKETWVIPDLIGALIMFVAVFKIKQ